MYTQNRESPLYIVIDYHDS